jgi:hypothetical protein
MVTNGIARVVDGLQSGLYSELEFFNLLAIRTSPDGTNDAYDAIPEGYKDRFLRWIRDYDTQSDAVCIGDSAPKTEVIEAFKQLRNNLEGR